MALFSSDKAKPAISFDEKSPAFFRELDQNINCKLQ